jgi:hypothetical protein
MNGPLKVLVAAAVAVAAAALLVVLYAGARHRAQVSHCRNNLRHLGCIAARNGTLLDPEKAGRAFWQNVREVEYKTVKGDWKPLHPDPFLCPVLGKTHSQPQDPAAIDFRGPKKVREQFETTPKDEPLGADRLGNHADGGHVLYLDLSVRELPAVIRSPGGGDPEWSAAAAALTD